VTISNNIDTTIEVYDFHYNSVTNAAPPVVVLTNLKMGHYFVQVNGNATSSGFGDRAQFSVWPQGYTNSPHSDIGELPSGTLIESNRSVRMAPGWSRIQSSWSSITANSAGTNDWRDVANFVHKTFNTGNNGWEGWPDPPASNKVINIPADHQNQLTNPIPLGVGLGSPTNGYSSPVVDETNSLANWIQDYALLWSNAAAHFTNSVVYEILNEPGSDNLIFDAGQDPYAATDPGVLPAAMAVNAADQMIKSVCTNCITWGPSSLGFGGWPSRTLTDSFAVAYYSNVNVLTFHDPIGLGGPVDAFCAFTNITNVATVQSRAVSDMVIANLYPGKKFAVTESYPCSPDVLGKTNSWWMWKDGGYDSANLPNFSWDWQIMTMRFWKCLLEYRATRVEGVLVWVALADANIAPHYPPPEQFYMDEYTAWDVNAEGFERAGCGPRPNADGQAMISWWFKDATPVTNWLSGTDLTVVDTLGGYTGTPGLHFYEWKFADGTTNTVIWADEQIKVSTNFGVGLTDIWSNQWTGAIGIEPVIAWGWPKP
jgi:hypothetical protein